MNIYYLVLAQIVRFVLRAAAIYLGYVGVSGDMQNELVETMVTQVVPVLLLLITEGWSFLQKKYFPVLLNAALSARSGESVGFIKSVAKEKSRAPVIY